MIRLAKIGLERALDEDKLSLDDNNYLYHLSQTLNDFDYEVEQMGESVLECRAAHPDWSVGRVAWEVGHTSGVVDYIFNEADEGAPKRTPKVKRTAKVKPEEAKASARKPEPKPEPKPVTPAWCKQGKLATRVELLRQALAAAGTGGLGRWDDVYPLRLPVAARNRGIDALVRLTVPGDAVEIDGRVYFRRFAPAAQPEPEPVEPAPEPAGTALVPVPARLNERGVLSMPESLPPPAPKVARGVLKPRVKRPS
jgi:hypothetical protein